MASFDVVSKLDLQEVDNAVNQARKEVSQRYDFKDSKTEIQLEKESIKLLADDDYKLSAVRTILETKLTKRGISLKALDYQKEEDGAMGMKRQEIKLISGLSKEKAKEIVSVIKTAKFKVQPAIQDDFVRVTSKSLDELQSVIQALREKDVGVPLQFTNRRN